MEGDFTSESGWTVSKLSSTLSCFTEEEDLRNVIVTSIRRSLIYPLYRSVELSYKVSSSPHFILNTLTLYCIMVILGLVYDFSYDANSLILIIQ